jgi:Family of unknown function (DUF5706)
MAEGGTPGFPADSQLADIIARAEKSLQRQHEWTSRYDARSSIVTALSIGMLGVLASAVPTVAKWTPVFWICCSVSVGCLFAALVCYFYGQFPRTPSPNPSLLFFGTICQFRLEDYRSRFIAMSDAAYLEDLLNQTHTVAALLHKKFAALRTALLFLLASVLPWGATLYLSKLS